MTIFLYILLSLVFVFPATYWLFPNQFVRLAISAGRRSARLRAKSIVAEGETWHYLDGGPTGAETVLLVHGFGADKDSWIPYARELTGKYRVIAPDLPGFGESARHQDRDYTVGAQTVRLHAFVTELGLGKLHLAGNSMGGHIAGLYALSYPAQLSSLALMDNAGVDVPTKSDLVLDVDQGKNPLAVSSMQEFEEMLALVTHKPLWIPGIFKRFAFERAVKDRDFIDRIFWSIVDDSPKNFLNERLGEIRVPTLVLWGRNDRLIHVSCVDVMAAAIPDNTAVILDETGHAPMVERPKETAEHHKALLAAATT